MLSQTSTYGYVKIYNYTHKVSGRYKKLYLKDWVSGGPDHAKKNGLSKASQVNIAYWKTGHGNKIHTVSFYTDSSNGKNSGRKGSHLSINGKYGGGHDNTKAELKYWFVSDGTNNTVNSGSKTSPNSLNIQSHDGWNVKAYIVWSKSNNGKYYLNLTDNKPS